MFDDRRKTGLLRRLAELDSRAGASRLGIGHLEVCSSFRMPDRHPVHAIFQVPSGWRQLVK